MGRNKLKERKNKNAKEIRNRNAVHNWYIRAIKRAVSESFSLCGGCVWSAVYVRACRRCGQKHINVQRYSNNCNYCNGFYNFDSAVCRGSFKGQAE